MVNMGKKNRCYKQLVGSLAIGTIIGTCQPAWSSGFQLHEQNAKDLGTAYAGAVSSAEDASTAYFNPAGLVRLGDEQIVASGVFAIANSTLDVTGGTASLPSGFTRGAPVAMGTGSTHVHHISVVPGLHYAKRIADDWRFGFSVTSPFGLNSSYQQTSIARYMATRSELKTIDIGPSLAYGFGNGFSIGVGVDALYALAGLSTQIGNNTISLDGYNSNTASNWGIGYQAGLLYEATDHTRFGIHYRSHVKVKTTGDSVTLTAVTGLSSTQGVKADIDFPETAVISAYHAFNEQWAVMADAEWTRWNRFKQLILNFDDGSALITNERFKNTYRVSLGASYRFNEAWLFRLGTAYDRNPTQDAYRTIRIPDQNRTWAAIGGQYRFCKNLALDVGYAHLFFKKASINEVAPTSVGATQTIQALQGTSKTRADLIGIQLTWDVL